MCCRKRLFECTYLQLEEFDSVLEHCYFLLALAFVATEAEERGIIIFGILVALNANIRTADLFGWWFLLSGHESLTRQQNQSTWLCLSRSCWMRCFLFNSLGMVFAHPLSSCVWHGSCEYQSSNHIGCQCSRERRHIGKLMHIFGLCELTSSIFYT